MKSSLTRQIHRILIVVLLCILLSACSGTLPGIKPSATPEQTETPFPTPTEPPPPTTTPLPPLAVLLAPPEGSQELVNELQPVLTNLAAQAGLRFQVLPSLSQDDLKSGVKIVVVLPPDPGVKDLSIAAPETQFIAVGIPGLEPSANLSLVGAQGNQVDQMGFLAGYIAAEITQDWRVGIITEGGTEAGKAARLGFTNGVFYFCGLCRPVYPPFPIPGYPLFYELPGGAGPAEYQAALMYFKAWQVGTVYVYPGVATDQLFAALAQSGINLIGGSPPPSNLKDHWVASIGAEGPVETVRSLWPELLDGKGGANQDLKLVIQDANPELLSPGKQHLAENMLSDLLAGYIDTGTSSQDGETP
jgi:hypothetical protein